MSTYCLGDVQGCYYELMQLLDIIKFDPAHDHLWFVGDLINRGPDSLSTLRFVKQLGDKAVVVLGNHDLHFLAVAEGNSPIKRQDTLTELLSAPDCDALSDWLRRKPLIHFDANLNYVMIHAGIPPMWNLKQALSYAKEVETALQGDHYLEFFNSMYADEPQKWADDLTGYPRLRLITNYLTRMRFCKPDGTMEFSQRGEADNPLPGYFPWFKLPSQITKQHNLVFGHWAALNGVTNEPGIFALDTGCVWKNCLTAMRLEDQQRFKVSCK